MFSRLVSFFAALKPRSQADLEYAYLCEATDTVDLEVRQRQIDAGLFVAPRHRFARYY